MIKVSRGTAAGHTPSLAAQDGTLAGGAVLSRQADLRTSIRPTVAQIDLAALRANAHFLRQRVGPKVAIYGVVKADAYGHGAVAVARELGPLVDALAVSLAEEGMELRQAGIMGPILVLGAYYGREHGELIENNLTPVVSDPADLERFAQSPARRRKVPTGVSAGPLELHLKADTGMNRLGVQGKELDRALQILQVQPRLRLAGLCTHFASADVEDFAITQGQLQRFEGVRAQVQAAGFNPDVVHAANTAATLRFAQTHFSGVRPGLALYGATPSAAVTAPGLLPVLSLRTRVMALHDVPTGAGVSYGHRFVAQRPSCIAVLPIGYADGYPRHLQAAQVLIRGCKAPLAGVVCMDMVMIDVTDVPGASVGDEVVLIGRDGDQQITLDDVAAWAGTINYEITCGISKRVPRIYHHGENQIGNVRDAGAAKEPVGG